MEDLEEDGKYEWEKDLLQLPPFGSSGVCVHYDEDCLTMTRDQHIRCFHNPEERHGICPFLDQN